MKFVAESNSLKLNEDVKLLTVGDSNAFNKYILSNENKTKYGVLFCIDEMDIFNITIPCKFDHYNYTFNFYTIMYNISFSPNGFLLRSDAPMPTDNSISKLKLDLDNAYLKYYSVKRGLIYIPQIKSKIQSFPISENRFFHQTDIVGATGAFYLFFPPMITFVSVLLELMREKDLKLRRVKLFNY